MAWCTEAQLDVVLASRSSDFSPEQKSAAIDFATLTLDALVVCSVEVDPDTGLPVDERFQLATALLAASLLTAAPVVEGGSLVSETIGGYRYQLSDVSTTTTALDVSGNPSIVALIGFCLPAENYQLEISPDYAACSCDSSCSGCDCRYAAHGWIGCPCSTPYRSTPYPYPARRVP